MSETNRYWPEEHDEALVQWQAEMAQVILNERTPEVAKNVLDRAHEKAVENSNGATGVLSITSRADIDIWNLTRTLYQCLGDKVLDLAHALLVSGAGVTNEDLMADSAKKRSEVEIYTRDRMTESKYINTIYWARGDEFMASQKERGITDVGEILKITLTLIATKEGVRRKLMEAARHLARGRDASEAWSIAVQGNGTLREIDQITDYEWWENLRANQEPLGYKLEAYLDSVEPSERTTPMTPFAMREVAIKKFFEDHPEPMEAKKLREALECERYREELVKLRSEHNPTAVAAKEMEIINRVFAEVTKYKRRKVGENKNMTDYERGFPVNLVKTRDVSCFSAPWLIATMLLECGFQPENLFYCATNKTEGALLGGHGSLVAKTTMQDLVLIDIMSNSPRQIPLAVMKNREDVDPLINLVSGKNSGPARVAFQNTLAWKLYMPMHAYLLPVEEGLASGHMLHTGLTFFHEQRYEEAKYAFKLALDLHPKDTDSTYYLGMIACKEGNLNEGKRLFSRCIEFFDQYMLAHFALAEIAMSEGSREEALARLMLVVGNNDEVYADKTLLDRAKRLLVTILLEDPELEAMKEEGIRNALMRKLSETGQAERVSLILGGNISPQRIREIVGLEFWLRERARKMALEDARQGS